MRVVLRPEVLLYNGPVMTRKLSPLAVLLFSVACASASSPRPDSEWDKLRTDHAWVQATRDSVPPAPPGASRREQIEALLARQKQVEPMWVPFMERLEIYLEQTGDPRAARLYADEKVAMGEIYMNVLSRYDQAMAAFRSALEIQPDHPGAQAGILEAESREFVQSADFSRVSRGMTEADVAAVLRLPREDWIKQRIMNGRTYSVWIYPRADGGAAAVYFDNGVVYHTNWSAAEAEGQP